MMKHSKKNDFDTSSNLPLNAAIIGHSDYIEKLKSPTTIPKYITDALSEIDDFYNDNNDNNDNKDRENKKLGVLITFRESTTNPSKKKTADNKIFDILYEFYLKLKEDYKNTISSQPLDRQNFEEQFKLGNNENDFALNFVIKEYKNLEFSGVKIYEPQRIGKSLSNTPDISRESGWDLKSTWDSIVNGLKFNSNSLSHSSLPASEFVNLINNFKALGSIPFFEIPSQCSQNSGGSDLTQSSWLDSAFSQSQSFVTTSFSRFFAPEKLEPSTEGDKSIQEEMTRRIKESLAKRLTAPHQTKPSSPEEALKSAISASQGAHNEAHKAMMDATAKTRRRALSPANTPPEPMRRTNSAYPAPARAAPSPPFKRANSVPSQNSGPQDTRIAFFGTEAKKHSANLKPDPNGPGKSSASILNTKKPRIIPR